MGDFIFSFPCAAGGLGCGKGFPGWYTNVSFHKEWIKCIIEMSLLHKNNKQKVELACTPLARKSQLYTSDQQAFVNCDK